MGHVYLCQGYLGHIYLCQGYLCQGYLGHVYLCQGYLCQGYRFHLYFYDFSIVFWNNCANDVVLSCTFLDYQMNEFYFCFQFNQLLNSYFILKSRK
jgi:hypothetical protein